MIFQTLASAVSGVSPQTALNSTCEDLGLDAILSLTSGPTDDDQPITNITHHCLIFDVRGFNSSCPGHASMVPLSLLGDLQQMLGYSQSKPMQHHHSIKTEHLTHLSSFL